MSHHKTFLPGTYVPGYKVHRDKNGAVLLHSDPTRPELMGKPVISHAKPVGFTLHFVSLAAKKRVALKAGCSIYDDVAMEAAKKEHASPRDLVKVPILRGFPCRFSNQVRALMRRADRKKAKAA